MMQKLNELHFFLIQFTLLLPLPLMWVLLLIMIAAWMLLKGLLQGPNLPQHELAQTLDGQHFE
jgi:hypothetical protein